MQITSSVGQEINVAADASCIPGDGTSNTCPRSEAHAGSDNDERFVLCINTPIVFSAQAICDIWDTLSEIYRRAVLSEIIPATGTHSEILYLQWHSVIPN